MTPIYDPTYGAEARAAQWAEHFRRTAAHIAEESRNKDPRPAYQPCPRCGASAFDGHRCANCGYRIC